MSNLKNLQHPTPNTQHPTPNTQQHNLNSNDTQFVEGTCFGNFSLNQFLSRFLCGGPALKECRSVSRLQLALVDVGFADVSAQATLLYCTIQRYELAKQQIVKNAHITEELLCVINKLLMPDRLNAGKIRTAQNWVGQSLEKATYIPPAPESIAQRLSDWLEEVNSPNFNGIDKAISCYAGFLLLHPFMDANGRMSRIIYEKLMNDSDKHFVHLSLYRMSTEVAYYQDAVLAFNKKPQAGLDHPYWQKAHRWTIQYKQKVAEILTKTNATLASKYALSPLNEQDKVLLTLLWTKPLVTSEIIINELGFTTNATKNSLNKLMYLGILKSYKLRDLDKEQIFVCESIFTAWKDLDELIFSNNITD